MKFYKTLGFMLIMFFILSACGTNINDQQDQNTAEDGGTIVIEPEKKFTDKLTKTGAYVMEVHENKILVVDASPQDFSQTGGLQEFYSAIIYRISNASDKIKVGQRVIVEADGPIMESYPAKGSAKSVEILPEYKPAHADLSESQVIAISIEKAKESELNGFLIVRDLSYDAGADLWKVNMRVENMDAHKDLKFEIADQ